MRPPKTLPLLSMLVVLTLLAGPPAHAEPWPGEYYGESAGRTWERIVLPGTRCGAGDEPYAFFYSRNLDEAGAYRLTIYLPGGGSTIERADGSVETAIGSLREHRGLLQTQQTRPELDDRLFVQSPENDRFIGPGHLALFPYCTQDFHSGRRAEPYRYDLTRSADFQQDRGLKTDIERQLALGTTRDQIVSRHPGLDFTTELIGGVERVVTLDVTIWHRGADNFEAAADRLLARVEEVLEEDGGGPFLPHARILLSGGSAGGFGTWYNARYLGDLLHPAYPDAELTLVPMGGSPTERRWDDAAGDIVPDPAEIAALDERLDWLRVLRPCEVAGGDFVPQGGESCDDALDLVRHLRDERYPGRDVRVLVMVNKEDLVAVAGLPKDETFARELQRLCKTIHRYGHRALEPPFVLPYVVWQAHCRDGDDDCAPQRAKRVHVPQYAPLLTRMQRPDGGAESPSNLLEAINRLAARQLGATPIVHVEEMPNTVLQNREHYSPVRSERRYLNQPVQGTTERRSACNVD